MTQQGNVFELTNLNCEVMFSCLWNRFVVSVLFEKIKAKELASFCFLICESYEYESTRSINKGFLNFQFDGVTHSNF